MNITPRIQHAIDWAGKAHADVNHLRKHSGEPYIVHPIEVMEILAAYVPTATEDMMIACLCHDVVEDTKNTLEEIRALYGDEVARMVNGLTDVSIHHKHLKRAERKEMDVQHIASQANDVKTIKCCDLISNTGSIIEHDPDFARVYMREKKRLLEAALIGADPVVYGLAQKIVDEYYARRDAITG